MKNNTKPQRNDTKTVCISVFKSGEAPTKREYTQKWIEIINQMEKYRNDKSLFL